MTNPRTIKTQLTVGTRIFNGGDMANPEHFGTISRVIESAKWGNSYEITPDDDDERKPYIVPTVVFSEKYLGHGGTRFVTEAAYREWRHERMEDMRRQLGLTAYRVHLSDGTSYATSMARGVTLEQAREYFKGWHDEDRPDVRMVDVTKIDPSERYAGWHATETERGTLYTPDKVTA